MKRKLDKKSFVALMVLMQMMPLSAYSDEADIAAPTPQESKYTTDELTDVEVRETVLNFGAKKVGADPKADLLLSGVVFKECWDGNMSIEVDSTRAKGEPVGIMIKDPSGRGRDCMKKAKAEKWVPERNGKSVIKLSSVPGGRIDLSKLNLSKADGAMKVELVFLDKERDLDGKQFKPFSNINPEIDDITYENAAVIADREARLAEQARARRIATLQSQVKSCRKSSDDLSVARGAAAQLKSMGVSMDYAKISAELDRAEKEVKKKEESKRLADLQKRVKNIKMEKSEDVSALIEDLKTYAADHPGEEGAKTAERMILDLAAKQVRKEKKTLEDYDRAAEILEEAKSISDLPESETNMLATKDVELTIGKAQFMCSSGGPYNCAPAYQAAMQSAQANVMANCMSYSTGWGFSTYSAETMNSPACVNSYSAFQMASQIPNYAQAHQQAQMAMQQQMQMQAMNQQQGGMPMNTSNMSSTPTFFTGMPQTGMQFNPNMQVGGFQQQPMLSSFAGPQQANFSGNIGFQSQMPLQSQFGLGMRSPLF